MNNLFVKMLTAHMMTIYTAIFNRAKEVCCVLFIVCISPVANAEKNEAHNSTQATDDNLSLQDQKRKFLRHLSESTLIEQNSDKEISTYDLLEYAEAAFVLKNFDKAEELSREVINTLESRHQTSLQMKDALLINYKSLLWKESPINAPVNQTENKRLAPAAYKRLMQYSYNNFETTVYYQVLENVALFMFELPIFSRHPEMATWPINQKSFRANYTRAITSLSIGGHYKTPNKMLQKLDALPDYTFAEPMKVYYYLGRNALIKHRFTTAEEYFTKTISYLTPSNSNSLYQYMAKDYLYHLNLRLGDKVAENIYWLQFEGIKPTMVFQPELVVSDDINRAEVAGLIVRLILSVSREGYIEHVELLDKTTASHHQVYMLVKDMMLRSRLSPTLDKKGELAATKIKLMLQVSPDIESINASKKEKLDRVLAEIYPGSARNQRFFVQRTYR